MASQFTLTPEKKREEMKRRLGEAKSRTKKLEARTDLDRPRRDIDWEDIARSIPPGLRSGLESTLGTFGDISGLQQSIASYGAGKLGIDPETAASVAKYTSPFSLFPNTEQVSAESDELFGRDAVTRYEPTTPQGQNTAGAANLATGLIGGPENFAKDVGLKLAMSAIPAAKVGRAVKGGKKVAAVAKPASQFALKPEGTMFHEISKNKLPRPLEDMTASYANERSLKPRATVSPEQLEGGTIIPLVGDRTIAGKELTGVNETALDQPVNLQGGPNFMRDNPDVWASDKGAVTKLTNRVNEAGAEGDPVWLMHSSMGGRSGDFSKMMSDAVMAQMKNAPVSSADRLAFDEVMRQQVPNWPGIDKVDKDWFAGSGVGRTALAQTMAQDKFVKMGFPDIVSTRKALTEPELLNRPSGASGLTIARGLPGAGPVTKPDVLHPTYNTNVPGEYIGGFEKPIPREIMFPDWAASRKPGENRSVADRSMLMGDIRQKADNKWLDGVMNYLRSEEGMKYGIGGAVSAGLLTQAQAEELFPDET